MNRHESTVTPPMKKLLIAGMAVKGIATAVVLILVG
jgi:hypothetical protein